MTDPLDRLGDAFENVAAPDQWSEIEARAAASELGVAARPSRRATVARWLAAAAVVALVVTGIVAIANRGAETPAVTPDQTLPAPAPATTLQPATTAPQPEVTQPPATTAPAVEPAVDRMSCASDADLDAIRDVLRSGLPEPTYDRVGDLGALLARSPSVFRATLSSANRVPLTETRFHLADLAWLTGAGYTTSIALDSVWSQNAGVDPLAGAVSFDGVELLVFAQQEPGLPTEWVPDVQGIFVACEIGSTYVRPLLEPAPFLDHSSLNAIAEQVRAATPTGVPFEEACEDRLAAGDVQLADPSGWDTFGPLGAEPGLDIRLPEQRVGGMTSPGTTSVNRVPGRLLITARLWLGSAQEAAIVALVAHDGTIVWRRCIVADAFPIVGGGSDRALLVIDRLGDDEPLGHLETLDLTTGELTDPPAALAGGSFPSGGVGRYLLFQRSFTPDDRISESSRFVVFDSVTFESELLPYPGGAVGEVGAPLDLYLVDGKVVPALMLNNQPIRVYANGEWGPFDLARGSVLVALQEQLEGDVGAQFYWSDDQRLEARNGLGVVVWRRPDLATFIGEGFQITDRIGEGDEAVFLARACIEPPELSCEFDATHLVAVSAIDGHTIWERGANESVALSGDGYAVVRAGVEPTRTYEMIDVRTGQRVLDSPTWDSTAFYSECCGGGDYNWVNRDGALAWTASTSYIDAGAATSAVRVWYPAGATDRTVVVDLLGG